MGEFLRAELGIGTNSGIDRAIGVILRGSLPFVVIMLLFMVLMSIFPEIATWLPSLIVG